MISIPGYKLLNCLHEGASSTIYRAQRVADDRPVIIKITAQTLLTEKKARRFRREIEMGQLIDSPYVVHYLELKQDPAYGAALIMEDDDAIELTSQKAAIYVKGDAQRLKQVIINLVANALKFTKQGGITLALNVLSETATQACLQFVVKDTGEGMTKEEQSRLFQRFTQTRANIASEYGGTGLGLEISDKLVKLMGGQIVVENEKGQGSQFSFFSQLRLLVYVRPTTPRLS